MIKAVQRCLGSMEEKRAHLGRRRGVSQRRTHLSWALKLGSFWQTRVRLTSLESVVQCLLGGGAGWGEVRGT